MKDLYCNYLLSQNDKCTAVGLSNLTNNQISHDEVTRFLNKKDYSSKDQWEYVKPIIRSYKSKETKVLIFDDTISEKPHSQINKLINWNYDHSKNRYVKGINILTSFYSCEKLNLPISYHTVEKEIEYKDKKTNP